MTALRTGVIAVAALAFVGRVHAAEVGTPTSTDLSEAKERVADAASRTKGTTQHLYLQQEQRLSEMIDDLQSGRHVDPAEIDRALQQANRPTP